MRVAIIHEDSKAWLCELEVVILDYPVVLKVMQEDEDGTNRQITTSVDTDEEFGTWCEEHGYCYEIVKPRNREE